ncbi:glycosyltransferase [Aureispira sp. CCB-QB1]|uniref:glycosyltransferase n=1 Tax=Aureispira sp. CCB-QB1 TaxID=1313421 RepID=UPI0018CC3977|nr:glycosyltransferase [Aureispira sp. CCB-QB1]
MGNKEPLVSIVAACFNHEKFLEETLDSIAKQSYSNIELIITDDGSRDNSVVLIKEWMARNTIPCTLIANEKNEGICKTFNKGLAKCTGKYFQVIACDDVMLEDKIKSQVAILEKSSEQVAVIYTDAQVIDENSILIHDSFSKYWNFPADAETTLKGLIKQNTIIAPSVLIRRSALVELGGYDEKLSYEDWDIWLRLARKYDFIKLEKPLVKYRHFSTSMSQGSTYRTAIAKDSVQLLEKHRGVSTEIDKLIDEAQRPLITALIENNDATTSVLWKKLKYEKTWYSLYMFSCSLIGIKQKKAHAFKNFFKKAK